MVTLEKVSKFILSDICLHVPAGACVGLIGPSGAGKTTLLKLVCGLLQPESGYVRILGKEPVAGKGRYGKALSVFLVGHWALEDGDTVKQAFALLRTIYHLPKEAFWQEYGELSRRLDFGVYEDKPLKSLSLGQRMRVELAAVLIGHPRLILLDEPNVGLDENGKEALWELLKERCQQGATVLVASHSLEDISRVCSRIALLEKGQLLYYGSGKYLQNKYASINTMELTIAGRLPDLEDLPIKDYRIDGNLLKISYDVNHLSAAEIMHVILSQTTILEVNMIKPDLADIIMQMKKGEKDESDRSK